MDGLVDTIMSGQAPPGEPINFYYDIDSDVAIGASWVNQPNTRGENQNQIRTARSVSLGA